MSNNGKIPRPVRHLHVAGRLYPDAWKNIDTLRSGKGKDLPDWPDWCFLPIAGWYAIVSGGGNNQVPIHHLSDVGRLAALGTWRYTQGIYQLHPEMIDALWETPLSGDLPAEVLLRLPEWCIYVETPGRKWLDDDLYGFFAHLEWDANNGRRELRLLLDREEELQPLPLHIGDWPLAEAINKALLESTAQAHLHGVPIPIPPGNVSGELSDYLTPLISILLYLCSEEPEVKNRDYPEEKPNSPVPKRTKKGWRLFPASKPRIWNIGDTIGKKLESVKKQEKGPPKRGEEGKRKSPRPHLRNFHWHGYWVGPKKGPRKFIYRWLSPIIVASKDENDESVK